MTGVLPFGRSDLLPRDQIALGRKYQSQVAWKGRMASIGFLLNYTLLAHIVAPPYNGNWLMILNTVPQRGHPRIAASIKWWPNIAPRSPNTIDAMGLMRLPK